VAASRPKDLGMVSIARALPCVFAIYTHHPQDCASLRLEAATHRPGYFHTHPTTSSGRGAGKTPLLSPRSLPYTGRDQSNANAESKGVKNETANSDNHTGNNRNRHRRLRLHLPTCPPPPPPQPRPPGNNCYAPPSILSATTWARPPYPPRSLPGPARPQVLRSMSYVASHIAYIVLQASHSERGEPCRRNLSEITPDSTD